MDSKRIELLAPAGDFESLRAAIGNGADSVYIGSPLFNARMKAKNFTAGEIPAAIDYAHERSCRVYLALNILLMASELEAAFETASGAWRDGADAIIVQDMGFADMLRRRIPDIVLHASTQAAVYDRHAVDACADLGFRRIILPREMSLPQIAEITAHAAGRGIETEVFAHGALCVCYSGQCLMSSMIGGRSGNRGECAQPCRLDYRLERGGKPQRNSELQRAAGPQRNSELHTAAVTQRAAQPRLGLKDLSAADHIVGLAGAGVRALKIEGRMRSPEYVGIVTGEYRSLIDAGGEKDPEGLTESRLLVAFNRGGSFTDGYLRGEKGPDMMAGSRAGSHGVEIGTITAANPRLGTVDIGLASPGSGAGARSGRETAVPGRGDVLAVRRGDGEEIASAPAGDVAASPAGIRVKGFHPDVIAGLRAGDRVFRMSDARLAAQALAADRGRTPLKGLFGRDGDAYFMEWTALSGSLAGLTLRSRFAASDVEATQDAENRRPLPEERCREQLSKSGDTPFVIREVSIAHLPGIPVSALNRIRRESLASFREAAVRSFKRETPPFQPDEPSRDRDLDDAVIAGLLDHIDVLDPRIGRQAGGIAGTKPGLVSAYLYEWDGRPESAECGADILELPVWSFLRPDAFEGVRELKRRSPGVRIAIALPPAFTGDPFGGLDALLSRAAASGADAVLSGSPGNHLRSAAAGLADMRDSSANVFNPRTASLFLRTDAFSVMASPELPSGPAAAIAAAASEAGAYAELAAYGRIRLMYSEHCPVGYNRKGCTVCRGGGPFRLRDRKNAAFPVICHPGVCTAEILNADILCVPEEIRRLSAGAPVIARLMFTDESADTRAALAGGFRTLISDGTGPREAERAASMIRELAKAEADREGGSLTGGHYDKAAMRHGEARA